MSIDINEYKARRQSVASAMVDNSVAIVAAATEVTRSRDTEYAFRQHSDFYYLTGFPEPDAVLVIDKTNQITRDYLFCRNKDKLMEIWQGRRIGADRAQVDYQFDHADSIDNLPEALVSLFDAKSAVYLALGESQDISALVDETMEHLRNGTKRGFRSPNTLIDVRPLVHEMRLFKSAQEIALMRRSSDISIAAHRRAMQFCQPGKTEYQIEAELQHEFAMQGARHPAYSIIAGAGANSCILHYTENADELKDGDLLLIDAGSEYQGYAADITRTFPVNGKFTPEQRQVYELVLKAQCACIDLVKPGNTLQDLTNKAIEILTQGLVELGILHGDVAELIDEQAYKAFYMHGIGHWLGLDVHDVGDYKRDDQHRLFEPGMVLTVEPGIYIDEDAKVDEKWKNIGIRIEDNILVTATGHENLTQELEKEISAIEALMAR